MRSALSFKCISRSHLSQIVSTHGPNLQVLSQPGKKTGVARVTFDSRQLMVCAASQSMHFCCI